ncbi:MAG TPA: transposase [Gemmatimonadaceae bacterium]|jgi:putative transposase|nr:transposase [Gemmatimonadaceae bacterium]
MTRQPRFIVPGQPLHVIQRGNNRSAIFVAEADYAVFREWVALACNRRGCLVHAYVFMTNHVHLLMTPATADGTGAVMQSVGRRYVHYFNRKYGRTGTLWEGRYRATLIDSEQYLLTCYRYIELNPVRAGLVANPGQYRWSSYGANALGLYDPLVAPHALFRALGYDDESRMAAYRALFHDGLDGRTMSAIRDATNKAWALGRVPEVAARCLNRRARPLVRGRKRVKQQVSAPDANGV